VAELGGEKIDIIPWNDDPSIFVANALSPAQVISVDIDEEKRIANVTVPERMLSLAIGREGQNARLAARLTGWRIDIRSDVSVAAKAAEPETPTAEGDAQGAAATDAAADVPAEAPAAAAPTIEPAETDGTGTTPAAEIPEPVAVGAAESSVDGTDAAAPAKKPRARKTAAKEVAS